MDGGDVIYNFFIFHILLLYTNSDKETIMSQSTQSQRRTQTQSKNYLQDANDLWFTNMIWLVFKTVSNLKLYKATNNITWNKKDYFWEHTSC